MANSFWAPKANNTQPSATQSATSSSNSKPQSNLTKISETGTHATYTFQKDNKATFVFTVPKALTPIVSTMYIGAVEIISSDPSLGKFWLLSGSGPHGLSGISLDNMSAQVTLGGKNYSTKKFLSQASGQEVGTFYKPLWTDSFGDIEFLWGFSEKSANYYENSSTNKDKSTKTAEEIISSLSLRQ